MEHEIKIFPKTIIFKDKLDLNNKCFLKCDLLKDQEYDGLHFQDYLLILIKTNILGKIPFKYINLFYTRRDKNLSILLDD